MLKVVVSTGARDLSSDSSALKPMFLFTVLFEMITFP